MAHDEGCIEKKNNSFSIQVFAICGMYKQPGNTSLNYLFFLFIRESRAHKVIEMK